MRTKYSTGKIMNQLNIKEDIQPLSSFRAEMASYIKQIEETKRPIILTQRGKSVAVLVGATEYQNLQERLELLEDIYLAEKELAAGKGVGHAEAEKQILESLVF